MHPYGQLRHIKQYITGENSKIKLLMVDYLKIKKHGYLTWFIASLFSNGVRVDGASSNRPPRTV